MKEDIILEEGLFTNAELAAWFGVKETSFKTTKKKKLEILKEYAEFEEKNGKIEILKVLKPVYTKNKNYQIIKDAVDVEWGDLNTGKRVAKKIYKKYEKQLTVKESTTYRYTLVGRTELFGKPGSGVAGEKGVCDYCFAKEVGDEILPLTDEEMKIKNQLLEKHFGKKEDNAEKVVIALGMLSDGQIKREEFLDVLEEISNYKESSYLEFMAEFEEKIQGRPVRATSVERLIIFKGDSPKFKE